MENETTNTTEEPNEINTVLAVGTPETKSYFMTVGQLNTACDNHKFILARFASGYQMGINTAIRPICQKRKKHKQKELSEFVSFKPCSFHEYISHKHPFI